MCLVYCRRSWTLSCQQNYHNHMFSSASEFTVQPSSLLLCFLWSLFGSAAIFFSAFLLHGKISCQAVVTRHSSSWGLNEDARRGSINVSDSADGTVIRPVLDVSVSSADCFHQPSPCGRCFVERRAGVCQNCWGERGFYLVSCRMTWRLQLAKRNWRCWMNATSSSLYSSWNKSCKLLA